MLDNTSIGSLEETIFIECQFIPCSARFPHAVIIVPIGRSEIVLSPVLSMNQMYISQSGKIQVIKNKLDNRKKVKKRTVKIIHPYFTHLCKNPTVNPKI